jgi:hypothetical protein
VSHLEVLCLRAAERRPTFAVLAVLAATLAPPCSGGEIRPYELPSQKALPLQQQVPVYPQAYPTTPGSVGLPAGEPRVDPGVYRRFRETIDAMSPADRDQLARAFEGKREAARRVGQVAEVQHYERLLQILAEPR